MSLNADHVVLIFQADGGKTSTGYLLPGGVILTCLHGLFDFDAEPRVMPADISVSAWLHGDKGAATPATEQAQDDDDWLPEQPIAGSSAAPEMTAVAIWPPAGTPLGDLDIGLLRITDKNGSSTADMGVGYVTTYLQRNNAACDFLAYADYLANNTNVRELDEMVTGTTSGFDQTGNLITRSQEHLLRVKSHNLISKEQWAGASGGAVFERATGKIAGVLVQRGTLPIKENNLKYLPLRHVSQMGDIAADFWRLSKLNREDTRSPPAEEKFARQAVITKATSTLGRGQQKAWFSGIVQDIARKPRAPAQICLIQGHLYDEMNGCADYLRRLAARTIGSGAHVYNNAITTDLGPSEHCVDPHEMLDAIEDRARRVSSDMCIGLGQSEDDTFMQSRAERLEFIRHAVAEPSNPRVFVLTHVEQEISNSCFVLAQRLGVFLSSLPALSPPVLVFILVQTGTDVEGLERPFKLLHSDEKVDAVRTMIGPHLAIDLNRTSGRFDPASIEPIPQAQTPNWLEELVQQNWLREHDMVSSVPSTAGMDRPSRVNEADMGNWIKAVQDGGVEISPHIRDRIISTAHGRVYSAREARDLIRELVKFD